MKTLWLDIETLPGELKPLPELVQVPSNYKDPEKIRAYQEYRIEEAWRKQALSSMEGRICCLSFAVDNSDVKCFGIWDHSEQEILRELAKHVDTQTRFAGFNIRSFDLNWIWHRAVRYGIEPLVMYMPRQRYSHDVLDVRDYWTAGDNYAPGKMQDIALYLDIPFNITAGAEVFDLYQVGKYSEIEAHCNDDVRVCREIARKMMIGS